MALSQEIDIPLVILTATFAFMILTLGIILFVIVSQKKMLKQQAEHQFSLLNATIQTQEKERKRIAADLHDDIGAILSAVKMKISQIEIKSKEVPEVIQHTKQAYTLLDEAVKNVRIISKDLLPATLTELGLTSALQELSERLSTKGVLNISINNNLNERLEYNTELAAYRIIQEALTNAVKHAKATQVQITIDKHTELLKLKIKDNGCGVTLKNIDSKPAEKKGLGLRNIESRVNMLNGSVSFNSSPGKGFEINIDLPVK